MSTLVFIIILAGAKEGQSTRLPDFFENQIDIAHAFKELRVTETRPDRSNPAFSQFACVSRFFPDRVVELTCSNEPGGSYIKSFSIRKRIKGELFVPYYIDRPKQQMRIVSPRKEEGVGSADRKTLDSGSSQDKTIKLWEVATGKNKLLASSSADELTRLWDIPPHIKSNR